MKDKYEHIKFIIQRFDHYYDTVNNKGSFYIGLNTFILGGVCAGYVALYKNIVSTTGIWIFLVTLVICSFLSILFTIIAIKPYLKDNHANIASPSLMYFEGIAKYEFTFLKEKIDVQNPGEVTDDALRQMHSLARGLTSKFKKLSIATYLLIAQFAILIPLFFLLLKNIK